MSLPPFDPPLQQNLWISFWGAGQCMSGTSVGWAISIEPGKVVRHERAWHHRESGHNYTTDEGGLPSVRAC